MVKGIIYCIILHCFLIMLIFSIIKTIGTSPGYASKVKN